MLDSQQLISAIWSISEGKGSDEQLALLRADQRASLAVLDRMIAETEEDLEVVRNLPGEERDQVVADFTDTLHSLKNTARRLLRISTAAPSEPVDLAQFYAAAADRTEAAEVQLQASWSAGQIVVWAGARGAEPEDNEQLATRLEAIGGPAVGWQLHRGVPLPGGKRAEAVSIAMKGALGWLVAIGAGQAQPGVGPSVRWLGRAALEGVRLAAKGAVVPSVRLVGQPKGAVVDATVKWVPALLERSVVDALANTMPGAVVAAGGGDGRVTATAVITAAVDAIVAEAIERIDQPPAPGSATSTVDVDHTVLAHLDGTPFTANAVLTTAVSRRLDQWARSVKDQNRPRLIVNLEPPEPGGIWMVTVSVPNGKTVQSLDQALRTDVGRRLVSGEWLRLTRLMPALDRSSGARRGQVAISQDEAWKFMSFVGATLAAAGFDVRMPEISRRKARAALRLFAEAHAGSVVGAQQLSNVRWSVLFDDAELTIEEIQRLARQARPLVQSRGKWVEVDRLDVQQALMALQQRESVREMNGAEILRYTVGLGGGLSGGVVVHGNNWANDIVKRAGEVEPVIDPKGFHGTLRTYQSEAAGWLAFLEAAGLGGCLALDMGLGKTPTVLAHIVRSEDRGRTLVIAPASVVGNWAAEAARFTPDLRVVVHHGASRASGDEIVETADDADIIITTYATAVRDIDDLVKTKWQTLVLDEAQAIKNATSDTAQELRRLSAHTKLALTGTPIENGLGDLWAILDFLNPGLVGSRASFMSQMSGDGEAALKALNGLLLFRRTKLEPEVKAELPDKIDELDHCTMTPEQIGLYQAVLDDLLANLAKEQEDQKQGAILAAITKLKQICNHPVAFRDDGQPLAGRSGKLARLEELVESVFEAGEKVLIFTHFATWGRKLAKYLSERFECKIDCYDGSLARGVRDRMVEEFQSQPGAGALVLSLKAGGTGLNLTAANHVVLYDRWWNPAVEDQARDRAWRIGQGRTVISHRLVCPGTIDERVEEVVSGKRYIANLVLPRSSSLADLDTEQLRIALGLRPAELLSGDDE